MILWRKIVIISALGSIIACIAYPLEFILSLVEMPCYWVVSDFAWFFIGLLVARHTSPEALAEVVTYVGEIPSISLVEETRLDKSLGTAVSLAATPAREIPALCLADLKRLHNGRSQSS